MTFHHCIAFYHHEDFDQIISKLKSSIGGLRYSDCYFLGINVLWTFSRYNTTHKALLHRAVLQVDPEITFRYIQEEERILQMDCVLVGSYGGFRTVEVGIGSDNDERADWQYFTHKAEFSRWANNSIISFVQS